MNLYDFLILAAYIVVIEGLVGVPTILYMLKRYQDEQTSDLFRMLHSIGFDFNEDTKKRIQEAEDTTERLIGELRLYLYDKFSQQLKNIENLNDLQIIKEEIKTIIEQYEKDKKEY